jgi:hypothetical protein
MVDKERRTVTLCEFTPQSAGMHAGRGPRLWAFGYTTLAKLFGMKEGALRQAVSEGRLDPADLEMVCESWLRFHPSKAQMLVAQMNGIGSHNTPEEQAMIEELRARVKANKSGPHPVTMDEIKRLGGKARQIYTGEGKPAPRPADLLDHKARPGMEAWGDINAKCAAGFEDVVEKYGSNEEAFQAGLKRGARMARLSEDPHLSQELSPSAEHDLSGLESEPESEELTQAKEQYVTDAFEAGLQAGSGADEGTWEAPEYKDAATRARDLERDVGDLDEYAEGLLVAGGFPREAAKVIVAAKRPHEITIKTGGEGELTVKGAPVTLG